MGALKVLVAWSVQIDYHILNILNKNELHFKVVVMANYVAHACCTSYSIEWEDIHSIKLPIQICKAYVYI